MDYHVQPPIQKRFLLCLKLAQQIPCFSAKTVIYSVFGTEVVETDGNRRLKANYFTSGWPERAFLLVLAETGSPVYFRLFKIRHICWQLGYFQSSCKNCCVAITKNIQSGSLVHIVYIDIWSTESRERESPVIESHVSSCANHSSKPSKDSLKQVTECTDLGCLGKLYQYDR